MPRAMGRSGCKSIVQDVGAEGERCLRKDSKPPEWSLCQWLKTTREMEDGPTSRALRLRAVESNPVSKSVRCTRPVSGSSVSCHLNEYRLY